MPARSGFTLITATQIYGTLLGELLATGQIQFTPVNSSGQEISFRVGGTGSGQMVRSLKSFPVVNGVLMPDSTGIAPQLPDTLLTSPINVGYLVSVIDPNTGLNLLGPGYIIQPSGPTFSLDTFIPNLGALATIQQGPPGLAGPAGVLNFRGTWDAATTYAVDDAVYFSGSSYVSIHAANLDQTPGSAPTYWSLMASSAPGPAGPDGPPGTNGVSSLAQLALVRVNSPQPTPNLVSQAGWTANVKVNFTTGALEGSGGFDASPLIVANAGGMMTMNIDPFNNFGNGVAFYAQDGTTFISGSATIAGGTPFSVPSTAAFLRSGFLLSAAVETTLMVVNGSTLPGTYIQGAAYASNQVDSAISAAVVAAEAFTTTAVANAVAAIALEVPQTTVTSTAGSSSGTFTDAATPGLATFVTTPFTTGGVLELVGAVIVPTTSVETLEILIATSPSVGVFTVVDRFPFTIQPSAVNRLITLNVNTDFAPRQILAGQYLGISTPSGGQAQAAYNGGTGYTLYLGTGGTIGSVPATGAAIGYAAYAGLQLALSGTVTQTPLAQISYVDASVAGRTTPAQTSAMIVAAAPVAPPVAKSLLLSEPFSSLSAGWTAQGSGTWTPSSSGLTSPSSGQGWNNILYLPSYYNVQRRTIRASFEILASGTVFGIGSLVAPTNTYTDPSSIFTVDAGANTLNINNAWTIAVGGSGTNPGVLVSSPLGFTMATGHVYNLVITLNERQVMATLADPVTGIIATVSVGGDPAATGEGAGNAGTFNDFPALVAISGQFKVHNLTILANAAKPSIMFFGDSITYELFTTLAQRWPTLVGQQAAGASYLVSGRSGGSSYGLAAKASSELAFVLPKNVVIMIGTNDASLGVSLANYEANVSAFVAASLGFGCKVYVVIPPPVSPGATEMGLQNAYLMTLSGVTFVRADLALTVGNDGVTMNGALYASGPHPNAAGAAAIAHRFTVDAPQIFD